MKRFLLLAAFLLCTLPAKADVHITYSDIAIALLLPVLWIADLVVFWRSVANERVNALLFWIVILSSVVYILAVGLPEMQSPSTIVPGPFVMAYITMPIFWVGSIFFRFWHAGRTDRRRK